MRNIVCKVFGKPAMIVGYGPGRKGKVMAIVVVEGALRAVRLKDIDLGETIQDLMAQFSSSGQHDA